MKTIWAPWRIEYILADKSNGCFLCEAFAANDDIDRLIVHRSDHVGVLLNRYPYTDGHLMVCPYRHISELSDLTPEESADLMTWTSRSVDILREAMHPHGFNIGINLGEAGGAGLRDHLHMHVVPRWNGDTNFASVLGDIRVIPQALRDVADDLRPRFAAAAG
jgi:ATP adenylyltransferase